MVSIRRIFLLAGGAVTALAAFPAQAEEVLTPAPTMTGYTEAVFAPSSSRVSFDTFEPSSLEMTGHLTSGADSAIIYEGRELSTETADSVKAADQSLSAIAVDPEAISFEETVSTSAEAFFEETETAQVPETQSEDQRVAQITRPRNQGVAPLYVGLGGNIGIVESDESAIGDFGLNIISKISITPRFAVRPLASFSEDDVSVAIPVTYNFDPLEVSGFNLYPSAGLGVDIGDELGLLVNAGVDLPISSQFTLNGQLNFRTTSDFGFGLSLGVAYNLPFSLFD